MAVRSRLNVDSVTVGFYSATDSKDLKLTSKATQKTQKWRENAVYDKSLNPTCGKETHQNGGLDVDFGVLGVIDQRTDSTTINQTCKL